MYNKFFKRGFDIIISLIGLLFVGIIFIPIAILIKLEDGGSIFYSSKRIGKNGQHFKMYKFRSMKINSPDIRVAEGFTYKSKDDPRVTKVGKFLRESSLDETPQFFNILIGQMSLIGPRPDLNLVDIYPNEDISYLTVKPGLTGFSQAYFRNESRLHEKIKNDKFYSSNISFKLDMKIFFRTIYVVLKKEKIYR